MTVDPNKSDGRLGARPNLTSLRVVSAPMSHGRERKPYVDWWLEKFGDEAYAIARDFMLGGGLEMVDEREAA